VNDMKSSGVNISVFISFLEIYQERVRDLGKAVSRLQETGVSALCSLALPTRGTLPLGLATTHHGHHD
jgi:hypothetical protein